MKNKEYISFVKMLEYIEKTEKYIENYTFEDFCNISKETMSKYNENEWNMIKGLRNRIVHDYEGINLNSIWYVLKNDINDLKDKINEIIKKEN